MTKPPAKPAAAPAPASAQAEERTPPLSHPLRSGALSMRKPTRFDLRPDVQTCAAVAADPAPKAFILWGSHAQRKAANVPGLGPGSPHLILRAPHPSPLSAHNGFFGSKPFSQANAFLEAHGRGAIDWRLPENPYIAAA